ncbi:MAG: nucleotidyltransferase [Patescibacteria group bacterium]|nr:nucleotidyltransferase [Patescibacteria group bacterium]
MPKNQSAARDFYGRILSIIIKTGVPFVIGGGFAVYEYTSFNRPTNDLDVFCKAGDFPKIVAILKQTGIDIKILDERWLAQVIEAKDHVDILFSSPNYIITVDDSWFENAVYIKLLGYQVKLIPKEELIWCKAYIQDRDHYDGADINHLILITGRQLNWKRLLVRMENHWEILLSLILNFRFVYPSERDIIPNWLLEELISRVKYQIQNPIPQDKICRGPLLSRTQYKFDITELGFEVLA